VVQDTTNHTLLLEHLDRATTYLDRQYATSTLAFGTELWKHPVHLLTSDEHGKDVYLTAQPT